MSSSRRKTGRKTKFLDLHMKEYEAGTIKEQDIGRIPVPERCVYLAREIEKKFECKLADSSRVCPTCARILLYDQDGYLSDEEYQAIREKSRRPLSARQRRKR